MAILVKVHLLPSGKPNEIRLVEISEEIYKLIPSEKLPDVKDFLELVYYFGQNDFQPKPQPGLSVGDVIEYPEGTFYAVAPIGFRELSAADFLRYKELPGMEQIASLYRKSESEI